MATVPDPEQPGADRGADAPAVSVVIPVHNEADNIPPLVDELQAMTGGLDVRFCPVEVIFVEDGSTDGTAALVDGLAASQQPITAIHLQRSFGQSAALAAGFEAADGDYIVPMDGDGQNDPGDIPALLERLTSEGLDCVSGWRTDRQDPWHKTVPSAIQTRLATLTGPDIHDFGCTLTAYRAEALDDIEVYGEGHRYIPAKLFERGYSIGEAEVHHRPRRHGDSRYGAGRLVRGFVDLLYYIYHVRFSTRPMHLFGGVGLLFVATGLAIGGLSLVQRFAFGVALGPRLPRLLLTIGLIVVGIQVVMLGFVAEMLTKLHYREDDAYRIKRVVE